MTLTIANGQFVLGGSPIREFGVNTPDLLIDWLVSSRCNTTTPAPFTTEADYTALFVTLAAAGIRFVRFAPLGHYTKTYRVGYKEDKAGFLGKMDTLVAAAESHGMQLIPNMFLQQPQIPAYFGERLPDELNVNSSTWVEKLDIISTIVGRYKNSSAIAMWEFGNEYEGRARDVSFTPSYPVSLPMESITLTASDAYNRAFMATVLPRWKAAVQASDNTGRAIAAGNQGYHWTLSLPEGFAAFVADRLYNDPTGTVGVHTYQDSQFYSAAYEGYGTYLSRLKPAVGVPFYVGEFGPTSDYTASGLTGSQLFQRVLDGVQSAGVQLAMAWNVPANLGTTANTDLRPDGSRLVDWTALVTAQAAYRLS